MGSRLGGWLVSVAAAMVIMGLAVAPFTSNEYVRFEQDRAGVGALTGYNHAELDEIADALLNDLKSQASGGFGVTLFATSEQVLNERERDHMRDVRSVFRMFALLVVAGAIGLVVVFQRARKPGARAAAWRSVANGAKSLAIGLVVVGAFALVAFDAAFELFHRLFFSAGSYTFDPATSRLVQLFPDQFWFETAIAVAIAALLISLLVAVLARRRAGSVEAWQDQPVLSPRRAGI